MLRIAEMIARVRASVGRGCDYSAKATPTVPNDEIPVEQGDALSKPTLDDFERARRGE